MKKYVLGIDQSTQGTKGIIFDGSGKIIARTDLAHDQIINEKGWVEHNPDQIMKNVIQVVKNVVEKAGIDKEEILTLGISNQRETAVCWNKNTGRPVYNAIVWQCARGEAICNKIAEDGYAQMVQEHSGIPLSPYYSAAKIAWVLQNVPEAKEAADKGELAVGTMDSYLVYQLTKDHAFKTDYSNASRTQMFNVSALDWDEELISLFGIKKEMLAEICDSNALYGYTDFDGYLEEAIPIHGVMGDSHGALYGQGCVNPGMIKATYGTGSSIMMNVGEKPIFSDKGVVTSLAWSLSGKVNYVLEGNINYTGAVITWLQKDLGLIASAKETEELATVLTVVMAAVLLTGCVKVVKIGHEGDLTGQKEFNPGDSVEAIWDSEVIPECEKKAVDVSDILAKYDGKLTEMGEEFDGLKTKAASYYNYAVKLEGAKIIKVDKDSFYGTVTLEVPGYTGKTVVTCQIGKYKNSSIRDDMSFINFSDFTNQTEWGQVNTSMLEKVEEAVVKPVYDDLAEGATVNLVGCFTADSNDAIVITPVVLEVK